SADRCCWRFRLDRVRPLERAQPPAPRRMNQEPPTIEHRPKPPIDKVIGVLGAIVLAIGAIWGLDLIKGAYGYGTFFLTAFAAAAALLLLGRLLDKRSLARKEGQKSGRS